MISIVVPSVVAAEALDPSPAAVAIALCLLVAASAVQVVSWVRTRPERPETGPVTMDLGAETPALVDLLTGGFRVEDDAVPATAVDLAARRWIDIEEVAGGNVIIRMRRQGKGTLQPYEQRVLRHIEGKSVDGVAPAAALTLGPDGVSARWWTGFVREVTRHGRALGLCRRRWDLVHLAVVWVPVALAWIAVAAMAATADRTDAPGSWGEPTTLVAFVAAAGVMVLTAVAKRITVSDAQAETPEGLAAASRWLGVREYLSRTSSFDDATAASVVIWERQLAYATAMGLAPVVQRQLPFETEHDRHGWSRATGHWRRVRIGYRTIRPGWGMAPWTAAFAGLVQGGFAGAAAFVGVQLAREEIDLTALPDRAQEWAPVAGAGIAAVGSLVALWSLPKLLLGLIDLFARRTVEGELIRSREFVQGHRLPKAVQWVIWSGSDEHGRSRSRDRDRTHHLAIDDGSDDRILAYRCRPQIHRSVRQGAVVRAKVSPRLGYVAEIVELSPPPATAAPVAHELVDPLTARAATAGGALIGQLAARLTQLEGMTDEAGRPLLDRPTEDGRTVRDQLSEAQQRLRASGTDARGGTSAGMSGLLGGLMNQLADALDDRPRPGEATGEETPED